MQHKVFIPLLSSPFSSLGVEWIEMGSLRHSPAVAEYGLLNEQCAESAMKISSSKQYTSSC